MDFTVLASQIEFYFGARETYTKNTYSFLQFENKFRSDYAQNNGISSGSINNISNYPRFNVVKDKNVTTINNISTLSDSYSDFQSNYNMYIFAVNQKNNPENYSTIKLYEFKIYDDNLIIRKFIPMLDKTKKACLYDMVECKCYYNQGTGEFLYG